MDAYLKKLKKPDGSFKRVLVSPLRYPGGKSKAVGLILEKIQEINKTKRVVSPFFGGGSVELCLASHIGYEVVGYDIFDLLINFWDTLFNNKTEFMNELSKFEITRDEFNYNRHVLLNFWEKVKPHDLEYKTRNKLELNPEHNTLLDDNKLQQAVYYFYNMCLSYGPMFLGWPSSNEINKDKFDRRIEKMRNTNFGNIRVSTLDFKSAIERHPDDFLFLDPPYYLEGDSKMFKGIYPNTNFAIHHNNFDHKKLCELLKKHRGGFLMTYNNCSVIREWYKDYSQDFPSWQYTYGQGETRIGKNRDEGTNIKESHEILIWSSPS